MTWNDWTSMGGYLDRNPNIYHQVTHIIGRILEEIHISYVITRHVAPFTNINFNLNMDQ